MTSGRGLPVAFFRAPVMQMAPATDRPRPKMAQFISHRRSAVVQGPPPMMRRRLEGGLRCEKKPSMIMVQAIKKSSGKRQAITPAHAAGMRSGLA